MVSSMQDYLKFYDWLRSYCYVKWAVPKLMNFANSVDLKVGGFFLPWICSVDFIYVLSSRLTFYSMKRNQLYVTNGLHHVIRQITPKVPIVIFFNIRNIEKITVTIFI